MSEYASAFKKEGITFDDLFELDDHELKLFVPQLLPRRRLSTKLADLKTTISTSTSRSTITSPIPSTTSTQSHPSTPIKSSPLSSPSHPSSSVAALRALHLSQTTSSTNPNPNSTPIKSRSQPIQDSILSSHDILSPSRLRSSSDIPISTPHDHISTSEYERGKNDTLQLARDKILEMKTNAQAKFTTLQESLNTVNEQYDNDMNRARTLIDKLRNDLNIANEDRERLSNNIVTLTHEKDNLFDKSQQYIEQTRSQQYSNSIDLLKSSMDSIYNTMCTQIEEKNFYTGEQILSTLKITLKNILQQQMKK
jgi:hypothetical protein